MEVNWVSHFLKRHQDKVLSIWTTGMDHVWLKADTEGFYSNYFIVLSHKLDCKRLDLCWPQWVHFGSQEHHRTSWNPTEPHGIPQNLMESHRTS
jgi:hypothetical protein